MHNLMFFHEKVGRCALALVLITTLLPLALAALWPESHVYLPALAVILPFSTMALLEPTEKRDRPAARRGGPPAVPARHEPGVSRWHLADA